MLHRRRFLSAVALTPVALSAMPAAIAQAEDDPTRAPRPNGAPAGAPSALPSDAALSELQTTELELAGDFRVLRAFALHFGALPFVLEGEGARFQIDVLRRDPSGPSGVFDTESLSLFVNDHGAREASQTRERGARALGAALERRLEAGVVLPSLASFAERRARHPSEPYEVDFERVDPPHSIY